MNRLLPLRTIARLRRRKPTMTVVTSVKIPGDLDQAIKAAARKEGRTQSDWIRRTLSSQINFLNAGVKT
jgi:hypothetical protein